MTILIPEDQLPTDLSVGQAVDVAYASELADTAADLIRGLPVLLECDKDMTPFVFMSIRNRLKAANLKCLYLDGRPREATGAGDMNCGFVATMLTQLREAVRGAVERRVVVLPYLDLMTTSQGGLTAEAREFIPLLYENPELVWLGFKDPSFALPRVIENLFPHRKSMLGVPRKQLGKLVTRQESRKFGRQFNPWALYKFVSGVNAVRLRKLLVTLEGEDYPSSPKRAHAQIRQATTSGQLEIPDIDLETQVGGYPRVKERLRKEILDVLQIKDEQDSPAEIAKLEELIPKGMIFWGPPGTGKTLFAKAMATAIGAAITVVSGPELKSRWVGESEENLRQIFHRARQSAPSIIVFDELDSFASARGTYQGSGVEHSMVNQLLTEMDGFHKEELVFVVGTTNFVDILDPALLRPGRFEFLLHIPHPDADDRRAILTIYNDKMQLQMTESALAYAGRRTGEFVEGAAAGTQFTGDHINALCRAIARIRLRESIEEPTDERLIDRALSEWSERPQLTSSELQVVATHEAGHAVCGLFCRHAPPIERISIRGDVAGALGYVAHGDHAHKYIVTRNRLLDELCVLMGGREGEQLLLDDLSIGSVGDLERATDVARALVETYGMGGDEVGVSYAPTIRHAGDPQRTYSPDQLGRCDTRVREILDEASRRARDILTENRDLLETLRDLLLEHEVLDAAALRRAAPQAPPEKIVSETQ
jgi:cell division protease FtsH